MDFIIVVSQFNSMITGPMLEGCLDVFKEAGVEVKVVKVPGALEIPLVCKKMIQKHKPKAVIALGCVIEGETEHYRVVCDMCSQGVNQVMLELETPILFEVLMVNTYQKAEARIEKGAHAAKLALEMDYGLYQ
jgi:6,7-dimethyl-8-ribityllumazine synthase